jgi:lysophospholipase L1-like esterase
LPLGDSITWGVGDEANGGYRGPLFGLALAANEKMTFTGSLSNGPSAVSGTTFPKRNEGHSGWGISTVTTYSGGNAGIATRIPSPAFDSASGGTPNIILLMIGTNDAGESGANASAMATRLGALMDKIIAAAPNATLVVAKITPVGYLSSIVNAYNGAIPGLVSARASAGKHVLLADMNTGFDSSTMFSSDNLHPNAAGYRFMASRWYSVIGPLLP